MVFVEEHAKRVDRMQVFLLTRCAAKKLRGPQQRGRTMVLGVPGSLHRGSGCGPLGLGGQRCNRGALREQSMNFREFGKVALRLHHAR